MKVLSIVRHAKAERPEAYPNDFSRPLTARGHKDAARLGALLGTVEPPVDCILSSPAARAAQTADHMAAELGYAKTVGWEQGIYLASAEALMEILRHVPEEAEHVMVIGHNPGLEELAAGLCSGAPDNSVLTLITATLAHFELDIARWSQIRWGAGQLRLLVPAKMLK
jgi:phosphohistidine phosphatase